MMEKDAGTGLEELKYEAVIGVLDPSQFHYYQPLWTLVGAGIKPFEDSRKPMGEIWKGLLDVNDGVRVKFIDSKCVRVKPEDNCVITPGGSLVF